ncbi:putative vacuolar fusion protein CCZ1-like [Apostichopus japonicus]|uniref:Putative vacuolar fusion protein CCZ1-like n=1 Tax=Stichopus japonicus TaxID=307972 RepID=A0A2G8KMD2_STIJA|nr:putative vacuolar fusion protein CCZ1-like [Apostichopus japonicus]
MTSAQTSPISLHSFYIYNATYGPREGEIVKVPVTHRTEDGKTIAEYHEEDVQDTVYQAVLKQAYTMFKFFMGSFADIVNKFSIEELKSRLNHFFSQYLETLRLNQSDILDIQNGIQFLPLDKNTYLRIQCFINLIEASFTQIKYTAFLYNDQLVWSGLEQDDMRTLYKYLTTSLFPTLLDTEESAAKGPQGSAHFGKFVKGPKNFGDVNASIQLPNIYIHSESKTDVLHLVVYRALSATVCLMVDGSALPSRDWFRKIDQFLGPQLSRLASDIAEQYANRKVSGGSQDYKFVYFNHMNLAQKTTVHSKKTASLTISPEILRLIADINADFSKSEEDGEAFMRSLTDWWVVGKKSDQREFYVAINQKNWNLIEVNEEMKKMCASHFTNIFFLD